jgi:ubiquinone/menaquinone biosynthesis C-methylase UbiE
MSEEDKKLQSKLTFDAAAASYDSSTKYKYPHSYYPYVLEAVKRGHYDTLLDLGCGTGQLLEMLWERDSTARYFGLDISDRMIEVARKRLADKATLLIGDSERTSFDDASFDVITCSASFHHYPRPQQVLQELHRILKPGGRLVLCDTHVMGILRAVANLWIRSGFSKSGDVHLYSRTEIHQLFEESGFELTDWHTIPHYAFICLGQK